MEYLSRTFIEYLTSTIKPIQPYIHPTWWTQIVHMDISSNKNKAKKHYNQTTKDSNTIYIYTDGSGFNSHISAAAFYSTISETHKQYIGPDTNYNTYAVELTAIELAADITQFALQIYKQSVIYMDSQPTIKATAKPVQHSGQAILTSVLDAFESVQQQNSRIDISLI